MREYLQEPMRANSKPRRGMHCGACAARIERARPPARGGQCLRQPGHGPGVRLLPPAASAGERRVDGARRVDPALGLFPAFLAAQGGHVEEGVGAAEDVGTPGEGRVGVEDLLALSQEAAEAGHRLASSHCWREVTSGRLMSEPPTERTVLSLLRRTVPREMDGRREGGSAWSSPPWWRACGWATRGRPGQTGYVGARDNGGRKLRAELADGWTATHGHRSGGRGG